MMILSYLLPKMFSFYLFEIYIIGQVVLKKFKFRISQDNLTKNENKILIQYFHLSIVFLTFKIAILLIAGFNLRYSPAETLIFEVKYFIYSTLIFLLAPKSRNFYKPTYIRAFALLFFAISALIFSYSLARNSLGEMLWRADEFGMRFVGFTGSGISFSGFELVGSTANAVGVLYVFLLFLFLTPRFAYYPGVIVSIFGAILTFSQSALVLLIFIAMSRFSLKIKSFKIVAMVCILLYAGVYLLSVNNIDIFFRVLNSLNSLIVNKELPSSILDRFLQHISVLTAIVDNPKVLFTGFLILFDELSSNYAISESYFIDVLKKYGLLGLILAVIHSYLFFRILSFSSTLSSTKFLFLWIFLYNLFFNNTLQNDVLLGVLLIVYHVSLKIERTNRWE